MVTPRVSLNPVAPVAPVGPVGPESPVGPVGPNEYPGPIKSHAYPFHSHLPPPGDVYISPVKDGIGQFI
jgi:hypothetical protein